MKFWGLVGTEIRVILRSGGALVWFFVMPVLFALFFGVAFRDNGSGPPKTALNVLDYDGGFLSRALVESLRADGFEIKQLTATQWKAGEWKPRGVEIPKDFTAKVMSGTVTPVRLVKDAAADLQRSSAAESRLQTAVFRLVGNLCLLACEDGQPSAAGAGGEEPAARYRRIAATPPQITVTEANAGKLAVFPTGFNHTIPAMIVQFVLMCLAIYGTSLLVAERRNGILRRMSVGPVSAGGILAVKTVSRILMGLLQVFVLFVIGYGFLGVWLGSSYVGLFLLVLVYSAAAAALSLLLATLLKGDSHVAGAAVLLTMVMSAFGGCWWPLEVVSPAMKAVAFALPTGWAMDAFHQLYAAGAGVAEIQLHLLVLTGMFLIFFGLAARLFRARLRS